MGFVFQNHPLLGTGTAVCAQLDSVTGGSRAWAIFNDYRWKSMIFFFKCDGAGDFAKPSLSQKSNDDSLKQRSSGTNPCCSQ